MKIRMNPTIPPSYEEVEEIELASEMELIPETTDMARPPVRAHTIAAEASLGTDPSNRRHRITFATKNEGVIPWPFLTTEREASKKSSGGRRNFPSSSPHDGIARKNPRRSPICRSPLPD